jgi:hypothetical protein
MNVVYVKIKGFIWEVKLSTFNHMRVIIRLGLLIKRPRMETQMEVGDTMAVPTWSCSSEVWTYTDTPNKNGNGE